jgi:hypothetical protein
MRETEHAASSSTLVFEARVIELTDSEAQPRYFRGDILLGDDEGDR